MARRASIQAVLQRHMKRRADNSPGQYSWGPFAEEDTESDPNKEDDEVSETSVERERKRKTPRK